jgi:Rps23 Pro-64 3,4-dihydroxylase Tpa1-like proline 4-hydroxylase
MYRGISKRPDMGCASRPACWASSDNLSERFEVPLIQTYDIDGYARFDAEQCRTAGQPLRAGYRSAAPFPHIVIDQFLDQELLRRVAAEFPQQGEAVSFNREQERLKFQFHPKDVRSSLIRNLLSELNSESFLGFIQSLTGIDGLIADPYYAGGGLHETRRGGHLSVHADFNVHNIMKVERRLNLLVYLNEDWDSSFGGDLELWDQDMEKCRVKVAPVLGRAVIFDTSLDSFHGHPEPLNCPPDRSRRSIALYYYTAFPDGLAGVTQRTTNFRTRKGTSDRTDWAVRGAHFVNDWVPPRLQKVAKGALRKLFP